MIIEPTPLWATVGQPTLLTPAEDLAVRRNAKFWTVRSQEGRRPALCRICGETIPTGERRLAFRHFNVAARLYDKRGFIHVDEKVCRPNLELDSIFDQQMIEAEAIGPELEER